MGVRIQELPETTGINKEDVLIVEDGQGTKKGTVQQLDEALGVSQLKEDLVNLKSSQDGNFKDTILFVVGGRTSDGKGITTDKNRFTNYLVVSTKDFDSITFPNNYKAFLYKFDSSMNKIGESTSWENIINTRNLCENGVSFINFEVRKMDTSASDISEFLDIVNYGTQYTVEKKSEKIQSIKFDYNENELRRLGFSIVSSDTSLKQCCSRKKIHVNDNLYIHMKVKFPNDVHSVKDGITLFSLTDSTDVTKRLCLYKRKTSARTSYPLCPCPNYNAFFGMTNNDWSVDTTNTVKGDGANNTFLIGEDTISLRFAGDCTNSDNQDICITVDDSVIRIYHKNTDSTIKQYAKTDYPSMLDLYNAIKSDIDNGSLPNFEIDWYNLDGYTPSDIIPCTVQMVAPYKNSKNGSAERYDAYPFYFTANEKDIIHDIEIVIRKDAIVQAQFIIDGYGYRWSSNTVAQRILNNDITIMFGEDASVSSKTPDILSVEVSEIIDFKYPNLRVYYAENLYKGTTIPTETTPYYMSERVLADFLNRMKVNGFSSIGLNDVIGSCNKPIQGNVFHFAHDDNSLTSYTDERCLNTYLRNDVQPSFGCLMHDMSVFTDDVVKKMVALRNVGFAWYPHTFRSDVSSEWNKSMGYVSYDDMVRLVNTTINTFYDTFGAYPTTWDFHSEGEGYNQIRYLKNHGFQLIFGETGKGLLTKLNRYHCKRGTIRDSSYDFDSIRPYLDSYLNK